MSEGTGVAATRRLSRRPRRRFDNEPLIGTAFRYTQVAVETRHFPRRDGSSVSERIQAAKPSRGAEVSRCVSIHHTE